VKLHERFLSDIDDPEVYQQKRQKTVGLFELLEARRCRHQMILAHFDEVMGPCDASCDICTGVGPDQIAAEAMGALGAVQGTKRRSRHVSTTGDSLTPEDDALFQRLRDLRKELADLQMVPAYIVFSDRVLVELAVRRPRNDGEMLDVPGVGPAKLKKYGSAFLDIVLGDAA
jgi:ATP-dependent DNA helicase RecQ